MEGILLSASLSEVDVKHVLETINPKKSSGRDPRAPPKLLKNVANGIVPSLINQPAQ